MSAVSYPKDPLAGRIVGDRFRLDAQLNSGAVGTVYRATDTATGSAAAVKLWRTADNTQVRARFLREAEALNTLKHPNIVEVFGVGQVGSLPFVAMELLEGMTLEEQLAPGEPLDSPRCFDVAGQFLSALAYAHRRGVVHRDLKPDNIFLVQQNNAPPQVKLLDFGLAKFLTPGADPLDDATITMTGMVMGTPLYMPPEQAAGGKIDARVDVYAAGCILFEMLSGRLPYLGDSYSELIRAHVTAPIPKLAHVRRDASVSDELQRFLNKAMAKTQEARFADAGVMLAALKALPHPPLVRCGSEPHPQPAAPGLRSTSAWSAHNNGRMLLTAALTAALLTLAAAAIGVLR